MKNKLLVLTLVALIMSMATVSAFGFRARVVQPQPRRILDNEAYAMMLLRRNCPICDNLWCVGNRELDDFNFENDGQIWTYVECREYFPDLGYGVIWWRVVFNRNTFERHPLLETFCMNENYDACEI